MKENRTVILSALAMLAVVAGGGCRASGIDVTIQNNSAVALRNVELDYPHASFGVAAIPAGKSFWSHIKPTDPGATTLSFEPEDGKAVRRPGPEVRPDVIEKLVLVVEQDAAQQWNVRVQGP